MPLIAYGVVAVAGVQVCFFYAIQRLSVGVALLLEYLGILLVVVWTWAVRRQRPGRYTIAGSVLALVGLILVLDLAGPSDIDPVGVLYGLGAAVGLGTYFVLSSRTADALPPLAFAGGGMAIGTAALLALGAAGVLPMAAPLTDVEFAGSPTSWLVPVLGLALIAAVAAYVSGVGAARILGARLASFVGLTEVLFAVLIAWALLSELPTPIQLGGGVLIIVGVALVRADPSETMTSDNPVSVDHGEVAQPSDRSRATLP
jgi:drug/metabolite transporter (DMT)-like permease